MVPSNLGKRVAVSYLMDVKTTPSALEYARQMLECAKRDIDASKILKKEGPSPLAVFHLQQAVEKTMKAELLIFGLYAEDEVRGFGHNSFRAFSDFWSRLEGILLSPGLTSIGTREQKELTELIKQDPMPIVKLSYQGICDIMATVDKNTSRWYETIRPHLPRDTVSDYEMFGYYTAFYGLMAMAAISYLHEGCTRYPDMTPKPDEYDEEMGIVKATPELLSRLDYVVGFLEQMCLP